MGRLAILAAISALFTTPASAAPVPGALTDDLRDALHCAAALALAAAEQQGGNPTMLALPPLAERGKRYFAIIGARAMDEAGLTREAVRDVLAADVVEIRRRAAGEPDQALPQQAQRCLVRLDAAVPPES